MSWHQLKCKTTGVCQTVASLDGIDLDAYDALPLAREPKVDEDVIDGTLVKNKDKHKEAKNKSTIISLTFEELYALIDERIAAAKNT